MIESLAPFQKIMVFLPILQVFIVAGTSVPPNGAASCAWDGSLVDDACRNCGLVGGACSDIDGAVSFLQKVAAESIAATNEQKVDTTIEAKIAAEISSGSTLAAPDAEALKSLAETRRESKEVTKDIQTGREALIEERAHFSMLRKQLKVLHLKAAVDKRNAEKTSSGAGVREKAVAEKNALEKEATDMAAGKSRISSTSPDEQALHIWAQVEKAFNSNLQADAEKAAAENAAKKTGKPQATVDECCKIAKDYGVNPRLTWGSNQSALQMWWHNNDCNTTMGGRDASTCFGPPPVVQVVALGMAATEKSNIPTAAAPATATMRESVAATSAASSWRMSTSTETCLGALKKSVVDIIGSRLKTAPTPFLLWDPAMHLNFGDNLITIGEKILLQTYPSSTCCTYLCDPHGDPCPETVEEAKNAAWKTYILHGGGNWGDLYADYQGVRVQLLENLASCCPETVIFGMPQNLYYMDAEREKNEAVRIESAIKQFKTRPVFFWRDRDSEKKANALYPSAINVLTPEIAWAIHPVDRQDQRVGYEYDLMVSARTEESVAGSQVNFDLFKSKVNNMSFDRPMKILYTAGWQDCVSHDEPGNYSYGGYSSDLLSKRLSGAVSWIRSAPTVVADKLHISVIAMLSGTPVVFVDNNYRKLQRTLEVSFDLAGQECADMRAELFGETVGEQKEIPTIAQAADFEAAARVVLDDARLAKAEQFVWANLWKT